MYDVYAKLTQEHIRVEVYYLAELEGVAPPTSDNIKNIIEYILILASSLLLVCSFKCIYNPLNYRKCKIRLIA